MQTKCQLCQRSVDISTIAFVARIIAWVCQTCFVAVQDLDDVRNKRWDRRRSPGSPASY